MANIRKTFNFRNGVQVDEDNLVVNSLGLVGIGVTVPTEVLDVRGNTKVVGVVTTNDVFTNALTVGITTSGTLGVATIATLQAGQNISLSSGIITATTGIVTFWGDGSGLTNIPTSQWVDVNPSGVGYTSIYARGFVGVVTDMPYFPFQVGGQGNLANFNFGVGIGSEGNVYATGIVTAGAFTGDGSSLTNLNANNISAGTISTNRLPIIPTDKLPRDIFVSGIVTAQSGFRGDLTGYATTSRDVISTANISINSINIGFGTVSNLTSGISTVNTRIYAAGTIGIQTNNPQSDLHIFKTSDASLQVTGETESLVILGRSLSKTTNTAGLKFGNTNALYPYSSGSSLDIINYDNGNLNSYLHVGNPSGINTGSFRWIYGKNLSNPLMSLTYSGNLGIGRTNPTNKLDVNGIGTFSSSLYVGTNLFVGDAVQVIGNITANIVTANQLNGSITLPQTIQTTQAIFTGIVTTGKLKAGLDNPAYDPSYTLQVNESGNAFCVTSTGQVGVKTDRFATGETDLDASNASVAAKALIVGKNTDYASAVDFTDAGKGVNITIGEDTYFEPGRFMIVPNVDTTTRNNFPEPKKGGIIFNTSTNRFQGYNGTSWVNLD